MSFTKRCFTFKKKQKNKKSNFQQKQEKQVIPLKVRLDYGASRDYPFQSETCPVCLLSSGVSFLIVFILVLHV